MTMLYTLLAMIAFMGLASLSVDLGRIEVAKEQLQTTTDAAARFAAVGLRSQMQGVSAASGNAAAVFAQNVVDSVAYPYNSATDLSMGIWSGSSQTFAVTTDPAAANAVRLSTSLVMGGTGHTLSFLSVFGKTTTIHAQSIAMITGQDASTYVSAMGNPWLAGMPAGTVSKDFRTSSAEWDTAGSAANDQSTPALIALSSLNISAGSVVTFDGVTGSTNYGGGSTGNADGNTALIATLGSPSFGDYTYFNSPTDGIANIKAPVNALVAVFLDDSQPDSSAAPAPLDFSTATARDYASVSPLLKQVFFVGDGLRADGEAQQVIVPSGATRMFIANFDGWQYNNNTGGFNLTVHAIVKVSTVMTK